MKKLYFSFLILFISSTTVKSQFLDPLWDIWQKEHGATIEEFQNGSGEYNYYLTWSSSLSNWGHDIYNQIIAFNSLGQLVVVQEEQTFISKWEAQEPISTSINPKTNIICSIWEDGADSDIPDEAVNVHGQLHYPDGTIIKEDWLIAGGPDAQHSAVSGHINDKFLAIYGDDYNGNGGTVKIITIDDATGNVLDTIYPVPNEEYTWWPVVTSNKNHTRALTVYQKDINTLAGSIIYEKSDSIITTPMNIYFDDVEFVNQQINWLDKLGCFVVIVKDMNFDKSKMCMVDTNGVVIYSTEVNYGVNREGKPAVRWDDSLGGYYYLYPMGNNDLHVLKIKENDIQESHKIEGDEDVILKNVKWNDTGIWSVFAKDVYGNEQWGDTVIAFFLMGNYSNNDAILIPVRLNADNYTVFPDTTTVGVSFDLKSNKDHSNVIIYPNPASNVIYVANKNRTEVSICKIYNLYGRLLKESEIRDWKIQVDDLSSGMYFVEVDNHVQRILIDK